MTVHLSVIDFRALPEEPPPGARSRRRPRVSAFLDAQNRIDDAGTLTADSPLGVGQFDLLFAYGVRL